MTSRTGRIGKFELIRPLGEGAMGEVFLARDTIIGREVAIKTIHPEALTAPDAQERFYREAQAAGRLNHPNLVTIHEFGEDRGTLYMAMEYVSGEDLASAIRSGELQPRAVLELLAQVCDGLAYAHNRGILHRDIKPSNIRIAKISGRSSAKILDFGIARQAGSELTGAGALLGTFGYMAPEYIQSGKPDARVDIFAVGVILYEALTGRAPFEGDTAAAVLQRMATEEPAPLDMASLSSISPAIQGVLDKALAKDPARRFASAEALGTALRAARDPHWSPEAETDRSERRARALMVPGIRPPVPSTGSPRNALAILAAVAFALGLAVGAGLWLRHRRQQRKAPVPPPAPVVLPVFAPAPPPAAMPSSQAAPPAAAPGATPAPTQAATPAPVPAPVHFRNLDEAAAGLERSPEEALAFLDSLVSTEPGNDRAVALRIVALYQLGRYPACAKAMGEAKGAGHPLLELARKYPAFRRMLDTERDQPRLPRRGQTRPANP
jgi:serine/threonine-protein kinase